MYPERCQKLEGRILWNIITHRADKELKFAKCSPKSLPTSPTVCNSSLAKGFNKKMEWTWKRGSTNAFTHH